MASGSVTDVRVAGLASAVPAAVSEVAATANLPADELAKVVVNTGVVRRHLTSAQICTSDLCFAAAETLLENMKWSRDSIDLLVFVSQTPDYVLPATSCVLHGRLGLAKSCAAFDLALGCSGYVYGLSVVSQLISTGMYRRALLLVGDTISKLTSPDDRSVAYLFGDAGTATALEHRAGSAPMFFELGTDGKGASFLQVAAGGFRQRSDEASRRPLPRESGIVRADDQLYLNGAEIFNFTLREVPGLLRRLLEKSGWRAEEVDWWVLHQANRFMLDYLGKRMALPPAKVVLALENYGNTSSASIPLALTDSLREQIGGGPVRVALAGFGVGFSWAAAMVTFDNVVAPPLIKLAGSP